MEGGTLLAKKLKFWFNFVSLVTKLASYSFIITLHCSYCTVFSSFDFNKLLFHHTHTRTTLMSQLPTLSSCVFLIVSHPRCRCGAGYQPDTSSCPPLRLPSVTPRGKKTHSRAKDKQTHLCVWHWYKYVTWYYSRPDYHGLNPHFKLYLCVVILNQGECSVQDSDFLLVCLNKNPSSPSGIDSNSPPIKDRRYLYKNEIKLDPQVVT